MVKEEKILSILDWTRQKINLEARTRHPFFGEREIWWTAFGDNIGQEINGKSSRFTRPSLVLKKYSSKKCFILPTTTQTRSGRTDYIGISCGGRDTEVILSQGRTVSAKRLICKIGTLSEDQYRIIKEQFKKQF